MQSVAWITRFALVVVTTVCVGACGSNGASTVAPTPAPTPTPAVPTPPAVTVTTVTISGSPTISTSTQMAAFARFSDGSNQDVTAAATWESSNPAFATVSSTGRVSVVGTGDVDLRATFLSVVGLMRVAVVKPAIPVEFVLSGVVRDTSTGLPLANVSVNVVGGPDFGRTTTLQDGTYRFDGVLAGRLLLEFSKIGYQLLEVDVLIQGDHREDVSLGPVAP